MPINLCVLNGIELFINDSDEVWLYFVQNQLEDSKAETPKTPFEPFVNRKALTIISIKSKGKKQNKLSNENSNNI